MVRFRRKIVDLTGTAGSFQKRRIKQRHVELQLQADTAPRREESLSPSGWLLCSNRHHVQFILDVSRCPAEQTVAREMIEVFN